jgi:lipid-A-disaccharide synthase
MTSRIMIVTGEASGDLHGANLLRAMLNRDADLQVCGMGGSELAGLGMEILYDAAKVSVVGIFEVLAHLGDILAAQRALRRRLESAPPDLLILIDLPDFNLPLAKKAKRLGIPVFYYISPQVWAWRSGRVKLMRQWVDKIGVILPFEEEFFRRHGVAAEYVGHPLLDTVETTMERDEFCRRHGIAPHSCLIGLLPGSRKREIASLLPVYLESARLVQRQLAERPVFLLPIASTVSDEDLLAAGIDQAKAELDLHIIRENRYDMMAACAVVIAASGTVTLELAILRVPMVVAYKLSPLTYRLAKLMVKLHHFSLPNLIAGERAVPELLQEEVTAERLAQEVANILLSPQRMAEMQQALDHIKDKLGRPGASEKAATTALTLLGRH